MRVGICLIVMGWVAFFLFFFFQAEDGIRDVAVTGVQTCAFRSLMHDPELLILDEPFSGLDPVNTEVVRDIILDMKRAGKTVIFSTHVMEHAEQICDHVLLINKGRILIDGPITKVRATGGSTIQLDYDGDGAVLKTLTGVTRVNDAGKHAEFVLAPDNDADDLLKQIVGKVKVRRFDTREASLHEIFVRAVGSDTSVRGE